MQIQIEDGLGAWLQQMAAQAGTSADDYASQALRQILEDREDYALAQEGLRSAETEGTISMEDVRRELGLVD